MIRTALRYHDPASLSEAVELLAEHGDRAATLGGGTLLVPMMGRGERRPEHLVDLRHLGLRTITAEDGRVRVGARATYADARTSSLLREHVPLLAQMADGITGGAQIHNLGTLGGSACYANPASDVPGCLVALEAAMEVIGPDGTREVPAAAFFADAFTTALRPGELLAGFTVSAGAAAHGYHKLKFAEGSWPIATAAAVAGPDDAVSITLGGVTAVPVGITLARSERDVAEQVAARLGEPWDDELAGGDYRRAIAPVIAERALTAMTERKP